MNLNNRFIEFLTQKTGATLSSKYLLAVSGGVDSMVMTHLFHKAGLTFSVAHCNFSLRAEESNLDHQLVKTYCHQLHIPFYDVVFDTVTSMQEQHLGVQETARNLRYTWFNQLLQEHAFDFIATAHHRDDNAETVLFNIVRGTGINGLKGIPRQNNAVIRPLLFADKELLMQYAADNQVPYRNDTSNQKDTYARNKLRNKVIPILKEVNAEAIQHIHNLSEYSYSVARIVDEHIKQLSAEILRQENDKIIIDCHSIVTNPLFHFYLHELLSPYSFNATQISDIEHSLTHALSGNKFISPTHSATTNRGEIIIQVKNIPSDHSVVLEKLNYSEFTLGSEMYSATIEQLSDNLSFEAGKLYIDADALTFPLTIRKWENGDSFSPLGMAGKKKVSDFLIDKKVSLPDKENTFVVVSNNTIAAILNHQIDDAFKVTTYTQYLLQLTAKKRGAI
ncbi:MAG: tRNA lysidine(34) synthetase TilS [Bacteroidota bacterium]